VNNEGKFNRYCYQKRIFQLDWIYLPLQNYESLSESLSNAVALYFKIIAL